MVTEQEALRDLDPRRRWNRALQAPGHTNVDFEVRVDFRRLHRYRLGRAKEALKASKLGALFQASAGSPTSAEFTAEGATSVRMEFRVSL